MSMETDNDGDVTQGKRSEFRRGWPVLSAATIGAGTGVTALIFYGLGSFTRALQEEFGWDRAQISASYLYTTVALLVSGPALGWLLDRYGGKRVALISIPLLALVFLWLSRFDGSLGTFYLIFALAAVVAGGTGPIVYTRVVNGTFTFARGLALGITMTGFGLTALVLPLILAPVINGSGGWRAGFLVLALIALVPVPFVLLGFRGRREATSEAAGHAGALRREALRSRVFWTLVAGFVLVGISVGSMIPHLIPLLTDGGLSPIEAASIASVLGVGSIAGRLIIGYMVDRFFAPFVATPLFVLTAGGLLLLLVSGPWTARVAALLIGLASGAEGDLIGYFLARYFGLRSYGFLFGLAYGLFSVGAAIGPIIAGAFFDAQHTYDTAVVLMAALLAVAAATIITLPRFHLVSSWEDEGAQPMPRDSQRNDVADYR